ncbi:metal ABC transporter substrate-binding protein [Microcella alkaliphila]|uniref:Periplasmic solute binding family protein n=1 Tax=Microcella alkaliphila TaxID=279828 RepID=A0A0U4WTU4_9MICO|nr:metal ABC transporter substrate-binding protein [Microcella alkaliphila]BAU31303.1 periplasmic solute binding family protein [Microcella alkaliphila]
MPKNLRGMLAVATAALVALAAGCAPTGPSGGDDPRASDDPASERPLVLTTFTVIADMVREVAGDRVEVRSVTRPGAEIHGYEPTPGDLRQARGADLVIENGLGLEAWFAQFIADVDAPSVTLSDGLDPVSIAGTDEANPHAWMSPVAGQHYVERIAAALAELDPAGADHYAERAADYSAELDAVASELAASIERVPTTERVLVSCEGAFSYLARDLGLDEAYLWPVNADQQATPQRVAAVIDTVREREVPAVFCESTVSADAMLQVAADTGARFGGTLYVDSLSDPDGPVPSYLALLRHAAETIATGLTS